jgi:hypothetical protein
VTGRRLRRSAGLTAAFIAVLALALPGSAGAFSKAIWGTPYRNGHNQFPIYKQLGVKIIEADLDWASIAPGQPKRVTSPSDRAYHWPTVIQQIVTQAKRFHMQVLLQITGAPPWSNGGHPWNWAPRPSAYATFAATAAKKYPSVHLWMVWGEPSRAPNWQPFTSAKPGRTLDAAQKVAPHNYARILDAAYGSLKKVSRKNLVVGGSTYSTGDIDTQQWIENLKLPNGRPPRMDIYAHNPFGAQVPLLSAAPSQDGVVQWVDLPRLAKWIDRYLKPGIPIFISEWTIPTAVDQEFNFYVDPPVGARWVTDAMRLSRHWKRIYGLGWIHVYDDPPASYGGLLTASGRRKPLFNAFAHG